MLSGRVVGSRAWAVIMRKAEADNLAVFLQGMQTQRPMTYTFMAELVRALGGRALEARITAADPKTIYANLTFEGLNGRQVVDARPSDALNLALRTGLPSASHPRR